MDTDNNRVEQFDGGEEKGSRAASVNAAANTRSPFENIVDQPPVQLLIAEFQEFKEILYKVNPSNVFIPELTRLNIFISFCSTVLTVIDKGTDGTSVVTSLLAGDLSTGILTLLFMYLSGIATLCIWIAAPGHVLDIFVRIPETWKATRYRLCCSCFGGRRARIKLFDCGCTSCHKPFFWIIVLFCVVLAPLSTPILFIIYFFRQVNLYRKCEDIEDIRDEETISYRVVTEIVSQAMIAECFFESAPQALLQMYVLATQFSHILDSQQRLRFTITIVVMISSMLELGLTVGGRWVDNLVAHPVMELRPDLMKFLLYTEAISFLLVRSTLICGTILVIRALLGSGLQATLIVLTFLLVPRFLALTLRLRARLSTIREGMGDYVGRLFGRVVATILFYPVLQYQWTLIYMECETVFLGLSCIFAYYGEYGVKAQIEFFTGVPKYWGRACIYGLSILYVLNIALRWTRVIYLLRLKNTIPEDTVFTVFKYCQSITDILDEWEQEKETPIGIEVKKFKLRQLNQELTSLHRYFEINFPEIVKEVDEGEACVCQYSKYLNVLFANETIRRRNSIAKFRPAENHDKLQLGDTVLYAELIDLILLRLHTFIVFSPEEQDKLEVCKGRKWGVYRDLLGKLLCIWRRVHTPRCPQQFLSRCPTFKFLDFNLLLDINKGSKLFGRDRKSHTKYLLWNLGLTRCSECAECQVVTLL